MFAILSQVFRLFIVSLRLPSHGRWNGLVGVDVLFHIISKRASPTTFLQALGREEDATRGIVEGIAAVCTYLIQHLDI